MGEWGSEGCESGLFCCYKVVNKPKIRKTHEKNHSRFCPKCPVIGQNLEGGVKIPLQVVKAAALNVGSGGHLARLQQQTRRVELLFICSIVFLRQFGFLFWCKLRKFCFFFIDFSCFRGCFFGGFKKKAMDFNLKTLNTFH